MINILLHHEIVNHLRSRVYPVDYPRGNCPNLNPPSIRRSFNALDHLRCNVSWKLLRCGSSCLVYSFEDRLPDSIEEEISPRALKPPLKMGRIAVAAVVSLWVIPISVLVDRVVPDPYMVAHPSVSRFSSRLVLVFGHAR